MSDRDYSRQKRYYERNRDVISMRRALAKVISPPPKKQDRIDEIFDSFIDYINGGCD